MQTPAPSPTTFPTHPLPGQQLCKCGAVLSKQATRYASKTCPELKYDALSLLAPLSAYAQHPVSTVSHSPPPLPHSLKNQIKSTTVPEGGTVTLSCNGTAISTIVEATWGCNANRVDKRTYVSSLCEGKTNCTLNPSWGDSNWVRSCAAEAWGWLTAWTAPVLSRSFASRAVSKARLRLHCWRFGGGLCYIPLMRVDIWMLCLRCWRKAV